MRLEVITWDDSCSHSAWQSIEEARKKTAARCVTVGWVVHEDKKVVNLVQSCGAEGADGQVDHIWVIPKGMIVRRQTIRQKIRMD